MKSVSVGKLRDLEKEGWKITPADKNAVTAQVGLMKAATAIVVSLNNIKTTIDKIEAPEQESIGPLLNRHYELIAQLIGQIPETERVKELVPERGRNGFIDKVKVVYEHG